MKALEEIGRQSGHPELAAVPWCLWGHSGGGIWSNTMCLLYPERVAAAFLRSGAMASFRGRNEFPQPASIPEAMGTPSRR